MINTDMKRRGYGKKGEFIGFERWGADVPGEESEMLTVMKSKAIKMKMGV